jgi:hypothetical protein
MIPDGFEAWTGPTDQVAGHNIRAIRNEISPFARIDQFPRPGSGPVIVDSYYGLAYDFEIPERAALYGLTSALPEYSGDAHANLGFLRTPFRRIPRILVRSRQELHKYVHGIPPVEDLAILFRGQNREYVLPRSSKSLEMLYGDANAREPSLLPSASRAGLDLEVVLPSWLFVIHQYLDDLAASSVGKSNSRHYQELRSNYNLSLLGLALAQHYGLPSVGLDVTPDIDVALFFALHEFHDSPRDRWTQLCRRKRSDSELSVIYVLCPRQRFRLGYDELQPRQLLALRPERQKAFFMHSGWGKRRNGCCENLFLALYIDPAGDFGKLPDPASLFPNQGEDRFGNFLSARAQSIKHCLLEPLLSRFRWVEAAD